MDLFRSVKKFFTINPNRKLTLAVYALTAFYRAQMLLLSSNQMQKSWGKRGEESPQTDTQENYYQAYLIGAEVNRVADKTPWESKCLVRALTARYLMHRKNILTTLYLGVGKDSDNKMIAHAWLRCGEGYLTGGNGEGYAVVAKFVK